MSHPLAEEVVLAEGAVGGRVLEAHSVEHDALHRQAGVAVQQPRAHLRKTRRRGGEEERRTGGEERHCR